jgi:hypothetical protein
MSFQMSWKNKNIIAAILLLLFLLPFIIKFEHHHVENAIKEHNQIFHEKCSICNFEFSVFLNGDGNIEFQKENPSVYFSNNYQSEHFSNLPQFSFLLLAPPILE